MYLLSRDFWHKAQPVSGVSDHLPSLDGLRAICVLLVILAHGDLSSLIPGGFGVTCFFFLSGFLITMLLAREWARFGAISWRQFYMRRALRLGPPLLLTMALACWLVWRGLIPGDLDPVALLSQIFFVYNYTMTDSSSADALGVLWSLSVEEQFYLVWPFVFIALARGRIRTSHLTAMLGAILIWRCVRFYGFGHSEWAIYTSTDTRADSLLFGCVLALMMARGQIPQLAERIMVRNVALVLAILVLCLTFVLRDAGFRSTLRYSLQGLALMPLFYYAVTQPHLALFRPLNGSVMRRIGLYSYSAYLVHVVMMHLLEGLGLDRGDPTFYIPTLLVLTFAWAALIHEIAEKPVYSWRARLKHPTPAPS